MDTSHGHGMDAGHNSSVGYDKSDLGARGILIFFVVLGVFAIAMHLVVLGMYIGMTRYAEKHEPESSPLAPQTYTPRDGILTNTANVNIQQFPQPRLLAHLSQANSGSLREGGEMSKFLKQEAIALNAQPWQDSEGHTHLPIAKAMQDVLSKLPVRAGATEPPPNYPGASRVYSYPSAQPGSLATDAGAGN